MPEKVVHVPDAQQGMNQPAIENEGERTGRFFTLPAHDCKRQMSSKPSRTPR